MSGKRYDVLTILKRASELGIQVTLAGDDSLKLKAKPGVMTSKAKEVIRDYKQEIIAHLRMQQEKTCVLSSAQPESLESAEQEIIEPSGKIALCATCLEESGEETPALRSPASDGWMYCPRHHPEKRITTIYDELERPVRMFEGFSSKEFFDFIIDEKLSEIKQAAKEQEQEMYRQVREKKHARLRKASLYATHDDTMTECSK